MGRAMMTAMPPVVDAMVAMTAVTPAGGNRAASRARCAKLRRAARGGCKCLALGQKRGQDDG